MTQQHTTTDGEVADAPSVLTQLRALMPPRRLQLYEALRIAELQANRLLELRGMADDIPIGVEIVAGLPRIEIDYDLDMPCSGASDWDSHRRIWVITLNALEPDTRQRLSLLHEYKHIIDHGGPGLTGVGDRTYYGHTPTEYLAEYFAGCTLMPKRLLKRAWADGIQRLTDLAELFDVSERAMEVRLNQLRLRDSFTYRRSLCDGRTPTFKARNEKRWRRSYHRALSPNRPVAARLDIIR